MMKRFFQFCLTLCYPFLVLGHPYSDFDRYQGVFTQEELSNRIKQYLQKDEEIAHYFTLTPEALHVYASSDDQLCRNPEYTVSLASQSKSRLTTQWPASLSDYRIAIDPGHIGGQYTDIEEKWTILPHPASSVPIKFDEATLNLLTAKILKDLLEQAGATVLLTHDRLGEGAYHQNFDQWRAHRNLITDLHLLFRQEYNPLDLKARTEKINAFAPHLTIAIHYNTHGNQDPITHENIPAAYNYNMLFVGGSFCKGELKEVENRYAFLRLLLTDDIDQSIAVSQLVLPSLTKHLDVAPVRAEDPVPYLQKVCMQIEEGIYARNLVLTRYVKGPICYGESLCQDHEEESLRLNARDLEWDGIVGPQRVKAVAQAYFAALVEFAQAQHSQNVH